MAQAERLYWMDARMQNGAFLHWQAVVERFEVQRRTVFYDMTFLRDRLGAPIAYSSRGKGWHYTEPNYQLPFLALSDGEADTLRRTLLAARTYLSPSDAEAVEHLAARLSPYVRRLPVQGGEMPAGSEVFVSGQPVIASHVAGSEALLADVRRAIDERRRVRLTYYSAHRDETSERIVQPYRLLNLDREAYLVAHCERRGAMRDFALHRIREWAVLEEVRAFSVPEGFDLDAHLREAFELRRGEPAVTVRVRFTPEQSRWVRERVYHTSQTIAEEPGGGVIVSLRVSGTAEVRRWILSFGADAEVLEPVTLRAEIRQEAIQIAERLAG